MEISRTKTQQPAQAQAVKQVQDSLRSSIRDAAAQQNKPAKEPANQTKPVVNTQGKPSAPA